MKAELKAKWVEALRSGKYEQGHSALRNHDNKFCCLGVLCDVVRPDGWNGPLHSLTGKEAILDEPAQMTVGLTGREHWHLIDMNDGLVKEGVQSFTTIASWIELNIETEDTP